MRLKGPMASRLHPTLKSTCLSHSFSSFLLCVCKQIRGLSLVTSASFIRINVYLDNLSWNHACAFEGNLQGNCMWEQYTFMMQLIVVLVLDFNCCCFIFACWGWGYRDNGSWPANIWFRELHKWLRYERTGHLTLSWDVIASNNSSNLFARPRRIWAQ